MNEYHKALKADPLYNAHCLRERLSRRFLGVQTQRAGLTKDEYLTFQLCDAYIHLYDACKELRSLIERDRLANPLLEHLLNFDPALGTFHEMLRKALGRGAEHREIPHTGFKH